MTEYVRERLGRFIRDYVDIQPGRSFTEEEVIRQAFVILVKSGKFTENSLSRTVVKECGVLIAPSIIREWREKSI